MTITHTIPGTSYREPQPVQIPSLTDSELVALSYAHFDKQFEVRTYKDMAGKNGIISGWDDHTRGYDEARFARIREAMLSLERFGLVESYYDHGPRSKEERKKLITYDHENDLIHMVKSGWRYKTNEFGEAVLARHLAYVYKCCDGCVRIFCVCRERTFCAEHGGGCHGSHD